MTHICPVCSKPVSEKCCSIQCDNCDLWVHQNKCSGLSMSQFKVFCQPNSDNWCCPTCTDFALPFHYQNNDVPDENVSSDTSGSNLNDEIKSLLNDINNVVTGVISSNNEDDLETQFHSNRCSYLDCNEFNSMFSKIPTNFSSLHLNIASLSKHFDELSNMLAQLKCKFSVIGISETRNLTNAPYSALDSVGNEQFLIPGFKPFSTPTTAAAGGVSLYISNSFCTKPRKDLSQSFYLDSNLESVFAEINVPNQTNIIVGNIYRHPCMSIKTFNTEFLKPLLHKMATEKKQILLLGDFNINLLKCNEDSEIMTFLDIMNSHLILPQIHLPTRITDHSKTLIDNIFSTPTDSGTISGNLCHSISDHLPQFCLFPKLDNAECGDDIPFFRKDWSKFNQEDFILDYLDIDWNLIFERFDFNPDLCFNIFNDKIKVLLERHVPTVRLTKRQLQTKIKPWITPGILKSISRRDFHHRKFIKATKVDDRARHLALFKTYRNLIVTLCRRSKKNHFTRYFLDNSNNMQKIWLGVRSIINSKFSKSSDPISLSIGDTISSNPKETANHFNNFFTSVADSLRSKLPPSNSHFSGFLKNRNPNSFFLRPTTPEEIAKVIGSFSDAKSSGPNSIPVRILKLLKLDISRPISTLINRSFDVGIFPSVLKISKVIPVFKNKGSPLEVSNYRPISLLSNIEKIYEKAMYSRLMDFLTRFDQIYTKQFGFRKKHSTIDTLIAIVEQIRKKIDKGDFACGVFVDLQKAFDTVDHEILLSKLSHYGIRGVANNWFRSYLSNRSQFVSIANTNSILKLIKHGVPQGSVLGPLLFLLYINDLHYCIRTSDPYHFADDTHLLNFAATVKSLCGRVNADLRVLVEWLNANKISLNASKTEFLIFRSPRKNLDHLPRLKLAGKIIIPSKHVKYLGVYLDEHLSWKPHVLAIATKLRRANGALSKLRHYVPFKVLLNVYHAIFMSHARYACQIWGLRDNSVTHRILTLQNTALRLMTFSNPRSSATALYANHGILKIFDLVKLMNILYVHKFLNQNLPTDILNTLSIDRINHSHGTRGSTRGLLRYQSANTTFSGLYSLSCLASHQWNWLQQCNLNTKLSELSLSQLKSLTTKSLIKAYTDRSIICYFF